MNQSFGNQYFVLILFGIPGAGKGSIASYLAKKYKQIFHLAPGERFRYHKRLKTDLYFNSLEAYIGKGKLVPSKITNMVMEKWVNELPKKSILLFDGYPRRIDQMEFLENKIIANKTSKIAYPYSNIAITINIDKEIAKERIVNRRICSQCGFTYNIKDSLTNICINCKKPLNLIQRDDDTPEIYERRYKWSIKTVGKVISKYHTLMGNDFITLRANKLTSLDWLIKKVEEILISYDVLLI